MLVSVYEHDAAATVAAWNSDGYARVKMTPAMLRALAEQLNNAANAIETGDVYADECEICAACHGEGTK